MAIPLYTPRVNNNDDTVRLVKVCVKPGDAVRQGEIVAEVETDKANYTVEAEQDGYVLAVVPPLEETIEVGSVLMWLGATPDETPPPTMPADATPLGHAQGAGVAVAEPTLKAALLLSRHGLSAADIPAAGERLTVRDIEAFLEGRKGVGTAAPDQAGATSARSAPSPRPADSSSAMAPGASRPLSPEERGMLRTVVWQRDEAVPGYVELQYDVSAWEQAAARYQAAEKLLLNPLLQAKPRRRHWYRSSQRKHRNYPPENSERPPRLENPVSWCSRRDMHCLSCQS
jgi:pyruvate/2-oxoglutarate dehydrogenase complex dihydrolipoamide acyltransferase (E2) component